MSSSRVQEDLRAKPRGLVAMKIEFLGTGGAITTPNPGCRCGVCEEARRKGRPYTRSGPCTFVHGPDVLIDTPEEIKDQLNRSEVARIAAGVYSHWHPDHVMGRRVWEMNHDWRHWPPRDRCTPLYLPEQVAEDFKRRLGSWEHLQHMERAGLVQIKVVPDGKSVDLDGTKLTPIRMAEDYVYAFLFEGPAQRVLVITDELLGWSPPEQVRGVDLAVVPIGVFEFHPLTGERQISEDHPVLKSEATFEKTLEFVRALGAKHVAFSHIEEPDALSYTDFEALERKLRDEGYPIIIAYDGLVIDVDRPAKSPPRWPLPERD
jgi:phosphoribosyl 1,2-cyclic phosphate phosphodiesterase